LPPSLSFTRLDGASTLLRLAGRPVEERTVEWRAGGRGGGAILVLAVLGDGAEAGVGVNVTPGGVGPGLGAAGSGGAINGTGLWNGGCSPSEGEGLVAALAVVGVRPTKLAADEEVKDGRDAWLGRRGGGGAGACTLTRRLDERERVESCDDRRMMDGSSVRADTAGIDTFGAVETLLSVRE